MGGRGREGEGGRREDKRRREAKGREGKEGEGRGGEGRKPEFKFKFVYLLSCSSTLEIAKSDISFSPATTSIPPSISSSLLKGVSTMKSRKEKKRREKKTK